jgi:hypothetical protein
MISESALSRFTSSPEVCESKKDTERIARAEKSCLRKRRTILWLATPNSKILTNDEALATTNSPNMPTIRVWKSALANAGLVNMSIILPRAAGNTRVAPLEKAKAAMDTARAVVSGFRILRSLFAPSKVGFTGVESLLDTEGPPPVENGFGLNDPLEVCRDLTEARRKL